ncbi:MAG: GntR family transcriptional regulator [Sphaerochaeta sp.]
MEKLKKSSMYRIIFSALEKQILEGTLPIGSQTPTEKELMETYSTSRITASRAVKELENLGYVRRIKAKGSFVNARILWNVNQTTTTQTNKPLISVVFSAPVEKASLNLEVLYGVETACRKKGFTLSVSSMNMEESSTTGPLDLEKELIAEVIENGSVGAIILPYSTQSRPEMFSKMLLHSFPFVLIDRKVFGIDAPFVSSDNKQGFFTIIEHLVSKGHTKIAYVSGNTFESSSRGERFSGYVQAMNFFRLPIKDEYIIHDLVPFDYNKAFYDQEVAGNDKLKASIRHMLKRLRELPSPPTAIAATNDYIALNIMNVAREMSIRIPEDLSVTGFDNLPVCSLFTPRLTTIAQPFAEMGQTAVRLLEKKIKDPTRKNEIVSIPNKLIVGDSVLDISQI